MCLATGEQNDGKGERCEPPAGQTDKTGSTTKGFLIDLSLYTTATIQL